MKKRKKKKSALISKNTRNDSTLFETSESFGPRFSSKELDKKIMDNSNGSSSGSEKPPTPTVSPEEETHEEVVPIPVAATMAGPGVGESTTALTATATTTTATTTALPVTTGGAIQGNQQHNHNRNNANNSKPQRHGAEGPTRGWSWRAFLSIEERQSIRQKIRLAYCNACRTYEDLLEVCVYVCVSLCHCMKASG